MGFTNCVGVLRVRWGFTISCIAIFHLYMLDWGDLLPSAISKAFGS